MLKLQRTAVLAYSPHRALLKPLRPLGRDLQRDRHLTSNLAGEALDHPIFVPRAATWGRSLGILDLELTPTGGISSYHLEYLDINEDVEKDPALANLAEEYLEAIDIEPIGVPELRQAGFIGPNACMNCHEMEY